MLRRDSQTFLAFIRAARVVWCVAILLAIGLPSAWGQLAPSPNAQVPRQSLSRTNTPVAIAGPPQPLIAYRRDKRPPVAPTQRVLSRNRSTHQNSIHSEQSVIPLAYAEQINPSAPADPRRLNRGAKSDSLRQTSASAESISHRKPTLVFPKMDALRSAGTGLGITLGLFLICAWFFRRGAPKPTSPLPKEVVNVLGRVQLAPRQFVQLMQVGRKLVLISVTPESATPITEVADPLEVDRLLGLCMRNHASSTTAEFQQVLDQLSREHAQGFLGREAASLHGTAQDPPLQHRST